MKELACSDASTKIECKGMVSTEKKSLRRQAKKGPWCTAYECDLCGLLHEIVIKGNVQVAEPLHFNKQKVYLR